MKPINQTSHNIVLLAVLLISVAFAGFAFYGVYTFIHNLITHHKMF
jgi:hypothetical protein